MPAKRGVAAVKTEDDKDEDAAGQVHAPSSPPLAMQHGIPVPAVEESPAVSGGKRKVRSCPSFRLSHVYTILCFNPTNFAAHQ